MSSNHTSALTPAPNPQSNPQPDAAPAGPNFARRNRLVRGLILWPAVAVVILSGLNYLVLAPHAPDPQTANVLRTGAGALIAMAVMLMTIYYLINLFPATRRLLGRTGLVDERETSIEQRAGYLVHIFSNLALSALVLVLSLVFHQEAMSNLVAAIWLGMLLGFRFTVNRLEKTR